MRLISILSLLIFLSACKDKVICPAFQSTYILDDSVRSVYYSYLWKLDEETRLKYLADQRAKTTDSTQTATAVLAAGEVDYFGYVEPYVVADREVKKTKYGMMAYQPYWLKNYRQRTAPMENVLTPQPEKVDTTVNVGEFVASDFTDSVSAGADSVEVVASLDEPEEDIFELPTLARTDPPKPKTEVKFLYRYDPEDKMLNVEQEYYNKHFGQYLYVNEKINYETDTTATDSVSVKSGWLKRFFSNLFGGKNRSGASVTDDDAFDDSANVPNDAKKEDQEEGDEADTGF